ncbi:MAG: GNAT family N-acetyltransferase [Ktedonobacterales bacterium]
MNVERFSDVAAFRQRAEPFLLANEAAHCLQLGVIGALAEHPGREVAPPYLALVAEGARVLAVALRTPPYNPVLSLVADADRERLLPLCAALVDDLRAVYGEQLPGVLGPAAESRVFAQRWQRETGQAARVRTHQRIYQLAAVTPVAGVPGALRRAAEADRALLERWLAAFAAEALTGEPLNAAAWVTAAFSTPSRAVFLWEDAGQPVALVAYGNPTPHGIRIGPVYTPPERRSHGYASAATAAVSQRLLDEGRRYCFLFTDLANPTSNAIYQAIGYRPVCDTDMYAFAHSSVAASDGLPTPSGDTPT